jgi:predicted nuclease of predicted toxin-antitoxin system
MNLVADECVDHPIIAALRSAGHVGVAIAELSSGISDEEVLSALAQQDDALLTTQDTDFGELVFRLRQATSGVLLVRLVGATAGRKAELVTMAIEQHGSELAGSFSVLDSAQLRIRRYSPPTSGVVGILYTQLC